MRNRTATTQALVDMRFVRLGVLTALVGLLYWMGARGYDAGRPDLFYLVLPEWIVAIALYVLFSLLQQKSSRA